MWRSASRRTSRHNPLSQQQNLEQAELRPRDVRLGMEAMRDDLDCLSCAADERFHIGKGKWCGSVRDRKHLGPSVSLTDVPAT
jgi:hypothetical protein